MGCCPARGPVEQFAGRLDHLSLSLPLNRYSKESYRFSRAQCQQITMEIKD